MKLTRNQVGFRVVHHDIRGRLNCLRHRQLVEHIDCRQSHFWLGWCRTFERVSDHSGFLCPSSSNSRSVAESHKEKNFYRYLKPSKLRFSSALIGIVMGSKWILQVDFVARTADICVLKLDSWALPLVRSLVELLPNTPVGAGVSPGTLQFY